MTAARGPGKPRALSPEREAMAATLRSAGYGVASVADLFGIAPRTLHSVLRRQGVESARGRRRLTVDQDRELIQLWRGGWTHQQLAEHFGVARETVALTIQTSLRGDARS